MLFCRDQKTRLGEAEYMLPSQSGGTECGSQLTFLALKCYALSTALLTIPSPT